MKLALAILAFAAALVYAHDQYVNTKAQLCTSRLAGVMQFEPTLVKRDCRAYDGWVLSEVTP